jgi:Cytochrome P450
VNHRHFGGSTAHQAPEPVPTLARLFSRPPSSALTEMANLDASRLHGGKWDILAGKGCTCAPAWRYQATTPATRPRTGSRSPVPWSPDRWAAGYSRTQMRASFFPFGQGIRNCIGKGFAWAESMLLLSAIVSTGSVAAGHAPRSVRQKIFNPVI